MSANELIAALQSSWIWVVVVSCALLGLLTACGMVLRGVLPLQLRSASLVPAACAGLLHGCIAFSVVGLGGIFAGVPLRWALAAIAALSVATMLLRRSPQRAPRPGHPGAVSDRALHRAAMLVILGGSVLWSFYSLQGLDPAGEDLVLVPWYDFYFHARQIGNFAQFRGDAGSLHLTLAGERLYPYHYASYVVPALIADIGGIPPLQVATSVYPVLGMVLTGSAMLVLAEVSAGAAAAAWAVALLFLLPDPSSWVPDSSRWSSYFFFQQVGVGSAYAVACMGLGLAHAMHGIRAAAWAPCIAALGLIAIAALFKVQIVFSYGAVFAAYVAWNAPWRTTAARVLAAAAVVAGYVLLLSQMHRVPGAPSPALAMEPLLSYAGNAVKGLPGFSGTPPAPLLPALALLAPLKVFAVTYGVLIALGGYLAWRLRRDARARAVLWLLAVCLASHAVVRLVIVDEQGPGYFADLNRKTVPWPYFVVVYCTAVLLAIRLAQGTLGRKKWLLGGAALGLAGLSAVSATTLQHFPGLSEIRTRTPIPAGLAAAALHAKKHAAPRERVQTCENDTYNQFALLAERPVFVSKNVTYGYPETAAERERFAMLGRIVAEPSLQGAESLWRAAKISWFLMTPGCSASWERETAPVFQRDGYRLYRTGRTEPLAAD